MDFESDKIFLAISNDALARGDLPDEILLLPWGESKTDRGLLRVTEMTFEKIQQQKDDGMLDRVIIDFEHNSVREAPTYQPAPRHHAGVGEVFCTREQGLGLRNITWTPAGIEYARNYPDVSPHVAVHKKTHEVYNLLSAGLVPNGGVIGLSFFSVQQSLTGDPSSAPAAAGDPEPKPEEDSMNMEEMMAMLTALQEQVSTIVKELATLKASPVEEETFSAKLTEQTEQVKLIQTDMQAEFARRDKRDLLTQATFSGKVISLTDDAVAKLSVADLKAHIDQVDPTVPLARRTFGHRPPEGDGMTVIEQYNAIEEPAKKADFYAKNRTKMVRG